MEGKRQAVHVPNTGRCRELLVPGVRVVLAAAANARRTTSYSLIAVYKGELLINIDSQIPHRVVFEALAAGNLAEFGELRQLQKEVKYGSSRIDIYFENDIDKVFMEVKGVTLEQEGVAMFPDAPTARGTRHLNELMNAVEQGYVGYIFFLIQLQGIRYFTPNGITDPNFSRTLSRAAAAGVKIVAYDSIVQENSIEIGRPISVKLANLQENEIL
jgi:sugar fermentation stimulation protein A